MFFKMVVCERVIGDERVEHGQVRIDNAGYFSFLLFGQGQKLASHVGM